jgi:hypothetical protein
MVDDQERINKHGKENFEYLKLEMQKPIPKEYLEETEEVDLELLRKEN